MPTSISDRFDTLFVATARPALPDPDQDHIAETELHPREFQKPSEIPDLRQVPPKIARSPPRPSRDLITSSDVDGNDLEAFGHKPKTLETEDIWLGKWRPRQKSEADAFSYTKDASVEAPLALKFSPHGLPFKVPGNGEKMEKEDDIELPAVGSDGQKVTGHFCVLQLVAKFPYMYMVDSNDSVSRHFFAANKFYNRQWDIYYIHPPASLMAPPILLLPYQQVQHFLAQIRETLEVDVMVPPDPFTITFFDDGTPQPEFLGQTRSRDEVSELQISIKRAHPDYGECHSGASPTLLRSFESFRAKCQRVRAASSNKNQIRKQKRATDRMIAFREGVSGLKRAQRYLGLRPGMQETVAPNPSLPWEEEERFDSAELKKYELRLDLFEMNHPAPHEFEKQPVIICFDVEAYERAHHLITEVGISTLDTLDLADLPPGPGGENWIKQIRSRHFRIKDHQHLQNRDFVRGNPDGFLFGESEFVELREAPSCVDACFKYPFSAGYQHSGKAPEIKLQSSSMSKPPTTTVGKKLFQIPQKGPETRSIVILGHDVNKDINFLTNLGCSTFFPAPNQDPSASQPEVLASIIEVLDVAVLYKVLKKEANPRSLGSVLADLGREAWGLHNGGNDARYTLEALVALAVKARLEDDEKAQLRAGERDKQIAEAERAREDPDLARPAPQTTLPVRAKPTTTTDRASLPQPAVEHDVENAWEAAILAASSRAHADAAKDNDSDSSFEM